MSGTLYIVATPIGNLEDITLRAIKILKQVDLIAAEDTRNTLKLLNHFEITKPLVSYHRHNEELKVDNLIDKLKNGENIAVVSDAGTPGISDPGEIIVKQAIENTHKLKNTLQDLKEIIENREIVLARELTKIHEEFIRGNIQNIIEKSDNIKGEIILLIQGAEKIEEQLELNNLSIKEHYKYYENLGIEKKEIIKKIAKDRGVSKNEIYMQFTEK